MAPESTNGAGSHGLDHHRGGSGAPLVLIHGIGCSWRYWRAMLPQLEERFDVLAVDMPGFGHSDPLRPGLDSTPEALADAVEDEMGRAGFDRAHIAGNSLGGWVALELARRGRAETVTAISPAGLQHNRERAWGRGILRGMRWIGRFTPDAAKPWRLNSVGTQTSSIRLAWRTQSAGKPSTSSIVKPTLRRPRFRSKTSPWP